MCGEPATDCVFREHNFFVLQGSKFGDNLYIYRETIRKATRGTELSALGIGDENTPSVSRKYEHEGIGVTKAKSYSSVGILVIRVNIFHGNGETFLRQLMTPYDMVVVWNLLGTSGASLTKRDIQDPKCTNNR